MKTYIIYKPFGMLSQFTKEIPSHITLADIQFDFEKDVYPIGRLDADSEGLLLLSNNKSLNQLLLLPENKLEKTYWVQVEGEIKDMDLQPLREGIELRIKKKAFQTKPAYLKQLNNVEEILPERNPPIRFRENIPESWVEIKIIEGKNRQVRKMFAAIGFPVLRLVRVGIGHFKYGQNQLAQLQPGGVVEVRL